MNVGEISCTGLPPFYLMTPLFGRGKDINFLSLRRSRTVDSLNNGNESEEMENAPPVINVNVIILQSASSRLLHQYISNVAPSSRIKVTSTSASPAITAAGMRKNNILCRDQLPINEKANYPNSLLLNHEQRFHSNNNSDSNGTNSSPFLHNKYVTLHVILPILTLQRMLQ